MKLKIRDMQAETDKVAEKNYFDLLNISVTPRPKKVHITCNCKGAYVYQVPL